MDQLIYKRSKVFSTRKVSVDQPIRLLGRNGIRVNKEKAEIISFISLQKRITRKKHIIITVGYQKPEGRIEHPYQQFISVLLGNKSVLKISRHTSNTIFVSEKQRQSHVN